MERDTTADEPPPPKRAKPGTAEEMLAQRCMWSGNVPDLASHLLTECVYEQVPCPNKAAGCNERVPRHASENHASHLCAYRSVVCAHCVKPVEARALVEHQAACPEAQAECPNAGCGVTLTRGGMEDHQRVCGWEEVECPCPGCEELMLRADVAQHVETSGAVHCQRAQLIVAALSSEIHARDAATLTREFTWLTDRTWAGGESDRQSFGHGIHGHCFSYMLGTKFAMAFSLKEPLGECTMHFVASIIGKDDAHPSLVVSNMRYVDFQSPPIDIAHQGGLGKSFDLTAAQMGDAVRADGTIKLCMVIHLHLPDEALHRGAPLPATGRIDPPPRLRVFRTGTARMRPRDGV